MQDVDAMMGLTTPASAWKKRPEVVTLPSGNRMKIRRANLQTFLVQGIIPNTLMTVVQSSIAQGSTKGVDEELQAVLNDPTKLAELMQLMDSVAIYCALEPRILPKPEDESSRSDEELYVDELDEADKTFIFNAAVGGTTDLEQFRS